MNLSAPFTPVTPALHFFLPFREKKRTKMFTPFEPCILLVQLDQKSKKCKQTKEIQAKPATDFFHHVLKLE